MFGCLLCGQLFRIFYLGFTINSTNSKRSWKILSWNVRGINSQEKWDAIRSKIMESNCDIVCLQETKRELFDLAYLKIFCPSSFNSFEFLPSV